MSLVLIIYLAGVIASISGLIKFIFITTSIMYALYSSLYVVAEGRTDHTFRKWPLYVVLITGFVGALLPSERTMWMMAGAYTGQQVMESNIGKQTIELIEFKLAEELEVIKGKAKEKTK